jgi:hypothetical protein
MQNEEWAAHSRREDALVEMRLLPCQKLFRLILWKPGPHGKVRLREVESFLEFQRFAHEKVCPRNRLPNLDAVPRFHYPDRNIVKRCNSVCYNDWELVSAAGVAQPFATRENHMVSGHPAESKCV